VCPNDSAHFRLRCNGDEFSSLKASYFPMARRNRLWVICWTRSSGPWGRDQWDQGSQWPGGVARSWHHQMVEALKTKLPFGPG
jgi:hypothetical protein